MAVYPFLLHVVACLWYVFFWSKLIYCIKTDENWHPQFQKIQELGPRYLTNWNLVNTHFINSNPIITTI